MAISTDRLSLSSLTDIPVGNYSTASDTNAVNNTRSLSDSGSDIMSGIGSNVRMGNQSLSSSLGMFDTSCNTSGLSSNQRSNYYTSRDSRNLGYGGSTLCSNGRRSNGMDGVLGNVNNLSSFDNVSVRLPTTSIMGLTNMINSTATSLFGSTIGGLISIPVCLIGSVLSGLLSALNKIGSSLSRKLGLTNLLNSSLARCLTKAVSGIMSNSSVTTATTGSVINHVSSSGAATSSTFIDGMLSNGTSRDTIYSGLGYSLSGTNDNNTETKLSVLNSVVSTDPAGSGSLSQNYTKSSLDNVIGNLDNTTNTNTTYGTGDYKNVVTGLNNVDSSWNKDSAGDTNYYRTNGNKRLSSLSATDVTGKSSTDTSGTYNTSLSESETIYAINAVA